MDAAAERRQTSAMKTESWRLPLFVASSWLASLCVAQVSDGTTMRVAHVPSHLSPSRACCHLPRNEPARIFRCILSAHNVTSSVSPVTLYTFVTQGIINYAAYSLTVNSAYAFRHRYQLRILGPHERMEEDARWNKVFILWQAVSNSLSLDKTKHAEFVCWLDADLILLDLDMKIELVAAQNPNADIIMSRDIARAEFVSNSGFIIVRVSPWSQAFLARWWGTYDRRKCCDQNAFTWLYDELTNEDRQHVSLLRADAINSDFPAWKRQKRFNQVLHLAGASSSLLRAPLFAEAMASVCGNSSANQLGLSRSLLQAFVRQTGHTRVTALQEMARELYTRRCPAVKSASLTCLIASNFRELYNANLHFPLANRLQDIAAIKSALEDALKEDDDDCGQLYNDLSPISVLLQEELLLSLRRWIFESWRHFATHLNLASRDAGVEELEVLKEAISAGFEWFLAMEKSSSLSTNNMLQRSLLASIEDLLQTMEQSSPSNLRGKVQYYKFKHSMLSAATYSEHDDEKLHWLQKGVDAWRVMAEENYFGSEYVLADPYKEGSQAMHELGTLLCSRRRHETGMALLEEAIELLEMTLRGYENVRIAARKDVSDGIANLARALINAGLCSHDYGTSASLDQSKQYFLKSESLVGQLVEATRAATAHNETLNYDSVISFFERTTQRLSVGVSSEGGAAAKPSRKKKLYRRRKRKN